MKKVFGTMEFWEQLVENEERFLKEEIENGNQEEQTESEIYDNAVDSANEIYYDFLMTEIERFEMSIQDFVNRYEKRYNTRITHVAFIGKRSSHYGNIGGAGDHVGRIEEVGDLAPLFLANEFTLHIDTKDNTLTFIKSDHDGRNIMQMVLMTQAEHFKVEDQCNDYATDEDYLKYLISKGKKPTKLDSIFKSEFGIK